MPLRIISLIGIAVVIGLGVVAAVNAPRPKNPEFFGICAQVVPVLIVALVFENRAFRFTASQLQRYVSGLTMGILGAAEFLSLHAVATGDWSMSTSRVVYFALGLGFGSVFMFALLAELERQVSEGSGGSVRIPG